MVKIHYNAQVEKCVPENDFLESSAANFPYFRSKTYMTSLL